MEVFESALCSLNDVFCYYHTDKTARAEVRWVEAANISPDLPFGKRANLLYDLENDLGGRPIVGKS